MDKTVCIHLSGILSGFETNLCECYLLLSDRTWCMFAIWLRSMQEPTIPCLLFLLISINHTFR